MPLFYTITFVKFQVLSLEIRGFETKKDGSIIKNPPNYNIHRIVFAHYKNNFGQTVYKFTGVFETQSNLCTNQRHVHRLISTSVNLKNENILNYAQKLS